MVDRCTIPDGAAPTAVCPWCSAAVTAETGDLPVVQRRSSIADEEPSRCPA